MHHIAGGALVGVAYGIVVRYVLRYLRHQGAGVDQQV